MQTEEAYHRQRRALLTVEHLAGPTVRTPRYERLFDAHRLALRDDTSDLLGQREALLEQQERVGRSRDLVDGVNAWQVMSSLAPAERLPEVANLVRDGLFRITVSGHCDSGTKAPRKGGYREPTGKVCGSDIASILLGSAGECLLIPSAPSVGRQGSRRWWNVFSALPRAVAPRV